MKTGEALDMLTDIVRSVEAAAYARGYADGRNSTGRWMSARDIAERYRVSEDWLDVKRRQDAGFPIAKNVGNGSRPMLRWSEEAIERWWASLG